MHCDILNPVQSRRGRAVSVSEQHCEVRRRVMKHAVAKAHFGKGKYLSSIQLRLSEL